MRDSEPRNRDRDRDRDGTVTEPGARTATVPVPVPALIPPDTRPPALPFWDQVWGRITYGTRRRLGQLLNWLGIPGAVANYTCEDENHSISIHHIGPIFTRIRVDQSYYSFSRFTGKFSGTGYSFCRACSNSNED